MILDQLKNPNFTTQSQQWNFVTDQVMGGVSTGKFTVEKIDELFVIEWQEMCLLRIMVDLYKSEQN